MFGWGELFNSELGEKVLVIRTQDERPLGAEAGRLLLGLVEGRAIAPGTRRMPCTLVIRQSSGVAAATPP